MTVASQDRIRAAIAADAATGAAELLESAASTGTDPHVRAAAYRALVIAARQQGNNRLASFYLHRAWDIEDDMSEGN